MPLLFSNETIVLPSDTGRRDVFHTVNFGPTQLPSGSLVRRADAAIKGFSLDYSGRNTDHHIDALMVDVDVLGLTANRRGVRLLVQAGYQDKNADDLYSGFVNVLVIAEVD